MYRAKKRAHDLKVLEGMEEQTKVKLENSIQLLAG